MSSALLTLLEQAETERDVALARMLAADETARQARTQAEQLHAYREDYRRRAPAQGGRSANIELMRCHHGFVQRLDQAIEQQRALLARLEHQAAQQRATLLEREVRVASVKKLMQRRAQESQRGAARSEQRRSDEAAMRTTFGRQAAGHDSGLGAFTRH